MIADLLERAGVGIADLVIATIAALAVAFFVWALPDPVFAELLSGSGLSAVVGVAEPPFAPPLRLGVAAAGGLLAFVLVALSLRALNRPTRPRFSFAPTPGEPVAPRLRRADAHPDAPARAPVSASYDLGEPFDGEPEDEEPAEAPLELAAEPVPEPAYVPPPLAIQVEPEPEAAPEAVPAEPAPTVVSPPEVHEVHDQTRFPVTPRPLADRQDESIEGLMQRLEAGLAGRTRRAPAPAPPGTPAASIDDRLRSAVAELQRLNTGRE